MARDLSREPITLAEAKRHLGVRTDHRDGEIARLIVAARERVELHTGRALVRRTIIESLDRFGGRGDPVTLSYGPVHSVAAVRYLDGEALAEIDTGLRAIGPIGNRWRLLSAAGGWPTVAAGTYIEVEYEAGFGPSKGGPGSGDVAVPAMLEQAMLLLIGTYFENHEGDVVGTSAVELPSGVRDLCRDFRPSGIV